MVEEEYISNSNKSKTEKAEKEIVQDNPVKVIKVKGKSELEKNVKDIKDYVLFDVLFPGVKRAISEIVRNCIDILLYGRRASEIGSRYSSYGGYRTERVSYRDYSYRRPSDYYDRDRDPRRDDRDDIVDNCELRIQSCRSMDEAQDILERLRDEIRRNKIVTVLTYYDQFGLVGRYTDERFGWTNLDNVPIRSCKDGWYLDMPNPMVID